MGSLLLYPFSFLSFVSILLLNLSVPFTSAVKVTEAEQLALESSGELLPPEALTARITEDLSAIRSKYPDLADVIHHGMWTAGQVLISLKEDKSSLDAINASRFGPSESTSIFQNTVFLITFQKPYNPIKLAEALKEELGIDNVDPDGSVGDSSGITLKEGATASGVNTYEFKRGWGDCPSGCINNYFKTFTVGPEKDSVKLVKEGGDSPADAAETTFGYGSVGPF